MKTTQQCFDSNFKLFKYHWPQFSNQKTQDDWMDQKIKSVVYKKHTLAFKISTSSEWKDRQKYPIKWDQDSSRHLHFNIWQFRLQPQPNQKRQRRIFHYNQWNSWPRRYYCPKYLCPKVWGTIKVYCWISEHRLTLLI